MKIIPRWLPRLLVLVVQNLKKKNVLRRKHFPRRAPRRGPCIGEECSQADTQGIAAQIPSLKRVARVRSELEPFDGEAQYQDSYDAGNSEGPTFGDQRGQEPEQSKRQYMHQGVGRNVPDPVDLNVPVEEAAIGSTKLEWSKGANGHNERRQKRAPKGRLRVR